jgi:hypothetical protein
MKDAIFWEVLIVLGMEGYLDFSLSVFVNLEEPYLKLWADAVNMTLTSVLILVVIFLPIIAFYLLLK